MNADNVIKLLGLEPLEGEGGMLAPTWRDEQSSAIYYLMRPGDFSALHRLDATELWHHYAGDPVEMLLLEPEGGVRGRTVTADPGGGIRGPWRPGGAGWRFPVVRGQLAADRRSVRTGLSAGPGDGRGHMDGRGGLDGADRPGKRAGERWRHAAAGAKGGGGLKGRGASVKAPRPACKRPS